MSDTTQNAGGDVGDVKTEGKETENGTEIGNGNGNGNGQEHRKDSGNGNGTEEHIPLSDAPHSEFVIVADASGNSFMFQRISPMQSNKPNFHSTPRN